MAFLSFLWLYAVIVPITKGWFFFTFDQARDMLWVLNQVKFKTLSLVGPWGSLSGVFFGPLWFWILIIPYLVSNGNPIYITIFNSFVVFSSMLLGYYLFGKISKKLGYLFFLFGLLNSPLRGMAGYAFSQHLLPILTVLLIYLLWKGFFEKKIRYFLFGSFIIGLMFHAEPPTAILSMPSVLLLCLYLYRKKPVTLIKIYMLLIVGFLMGILPLILFDLRHDFIQTKAIISYFKGQNESLGGVLPIDERVVDRITKFLTIFGEVIRTNGYILLPLFTLCGYVNLHLIKETKKRALGVVVGMYIGTLLLGFMIYPPELKVFYLDGLVIAMILWMVLLVDYYCGIKKISSIFFLIMGPAIFISLNIFNLKLNQKSTSLYINQINAVDWIYKDANGSGFKVYTFSQAIYDFPYQYIILNYGYKKYGYLPEEFSYLPNVPEYVLRKGELLKNYKITKSDSYIYLIIDPDNYVDRRTKWLMNFPIKKYPLINYFTFPDGTVIEKRDTML